MSLLALFFIPLTVVCIVDLIVEVLKPIKEGNL